MLTSFALSLFPQITHANEVTEVRVLSAKNISDKLKLAEKHKRTNPTKFNELIYELQGQPNLKNEQKQHLNFLIAFSFIYSGQFDKAASKLRALQKEKLNKLLRYRVNYSLIVVATATKNWSEGLKHIAINNEILQYIDDIEQYQNGLLSVIVFYSQMRQYQLALKYIDKLSNQTLSPTNTCALKQLNLEARFNLKELKLNDTNFNDAIDDCINANFLIPAHIVRLHKAKLYLRNDMPQEALEFLLGHLNDAKATQYPMLIAEMHNVLARSFIKINDLESAKSQAQAALAVNSNVSNLLQGVDTYLLLYEIAKAENSPTLALEYYEKYAEIERANLEGEKAKHLAFQLAQHKTAEQETQIALLNEKNALLETKQALSEAEVTNTRLFITVLIISLLLFTFWGGRLYKAHKRIKELAEFDSLTGIFNRGHFTQVATSALNYCESAKQELSVIIFDLDHFKSVNDTYGHATGDWALIEAISVCKDFGRQNDIFARLGGEEFCILLPSCDIRTAALRAEQCRQAIEGIVTEASGHDFKLTASFGVTDAKTSGFVLEKLLADADSAAYESKHAGRNRITVFTIEEKPEQKQLDSSWSIT
ncbi:tetratricopeptide repeat-containing diguanylate cyclase [Litorilituus lipolyticus]|nr:GGDEF domain-containing protein [Litorilituus lipolyticus]